MIGCFLLCWLACYLCIYKGIRTSGKAAYVTVIAPYVLMFALFARGVTLEGAGDGIRYYITPNITRLSEPAVWLDGGTQIIYSLGICYGCFYGMGSYNKFSFDCYNSLFFGFVVFSFLGHMAFTQGKNVTDIAEGGPGLVFLVFPNAFHTLPAPQVWAAAFFLGMSFLAIDGVFTIVEGNITALADYWPDYFGHKGAQIWRAGFCGALILLSLPQFADNGIYIFELVNRYGASGIALLWVAIAETVAVAWIYGIDKFWDNVKSMIGYFPSVLMKYCIQFITPLFCVAIFIACCVEYTPLTLGNYSYPWWGEVIGWALHLSSMLCVPVVGLCVFCRARGSTFREKWKYITMSRLETKLDAEETDLDMGKMIV